MVILALDTTTAAAIVARPRIAFFVSASVRRPDAEPAGIAL